MSQEILTNLQSEIDKRLSKIEVAKTARDTALASNQAVVDAAQAEYDSFIDQIASSLKIARPSGQSRETVERRQAKVRELYKNGKTAPEIAVELGVQAKTVHNDLRKLRNNKQISDDSSLLAPQATKILELFREGEAVTDIADVLKITTAEVKLTVDSLRSRGLLPPAGEEPAPATASRADESDDSEESEKSDDAVDDNNSDVDNESSDRPATREQLMAEVTKQQLGIKSKVAVLQTTVVRKHTHKVKVDRMGDGQTIPDSSGHAHRCYRFVLSEAHKHTHDLVVRN